MTRKQPTFDLNDAEPRHTGAARDQGPDGGQVDPRQGGGRPPFRKKVPRSAAVAKCGRRVEAAAERRSACGRDLARFVHTRRRSPIKLQPQELGKLAELGINHNQSALWRRRRPLPQETFERILRSPMSRAKTSRPRPVAMGAMARRTEDRNVHGLNPTVRKPTDSGGRSADVDHIDLHCRNGSASVSVARVVKCQDERGWRVYSSNSRNIERFSRQSGAYSRRPTRFHLFVRPKTDHRPIA